MKQLYMIMFICLLLLSGCNGGGEQSSGNQETYDTTKKMVTDILKTDEGKKAITDVLADEEMQKTYVIESKIVEDAVTKALSSEEGKAFWDKMFADPKFVKGFSQSLMEQQKEVLKGLMGDSEYQSKMMEILANPEMEKQMVTVLKGQQFREHLEKTIQETMNSPLFKAEMTEVILKAAQEMKGSQSGSGQEEQKGSSGSSGENSQQSESGGQSS
ncbi:Spore germination protein GerD precursor [Paraliobacillus sp. PM-2]|uniref:spore germination lipoprotein GerD n=1 Tax=Paraliobacillus sp. PM-2 TaxID=1462524 RepID=UPI00061C438D|nr:spore germination lipoprotein GerD [Paraliobacillus sp. PM-2]CQR48475.1 Spore germination protein GerD precursor [Paraliobacillus sp. PM-2]